MHILILKMDKVFDVQNMTEFICMVIYPNCFSQPFFMYKIQTKSNKDVDKIKAWELFIPQMTTKSNFVPISSGKTLSKALIGST